MKSVFISYNKNDKAIACNIAIYLAAENINVWFDEWDIQAGDSIVDEINNSLNNCSHFIVVWSKHSSKSNWVRKELSSTLSRSIETGKPHVIPIVLDNTPLPALLADIKRIKYSEGLEKERYEIINSITGDSPSNNFPRAIVKKYHEIVYSLKNGDPFGAKYCPMCGSSRLKRSQALDSKRDELYYFIECQECRWSDWTQ